MLTAKCIVCCMMKIKQVYCLLANNTDYMCISYITPRREISDLRHLTLVPRDVNQILVSY